MIEGIDILNKTEIMNSPSWGLIFVVVGDLLIVIGLVLLANGANDGCGPMFVFGLFACVISACLIISALVNTNTIPTGCYRYEVTIDDSVSFLDLQEKYDVIEQNGKIWTLEDKEVKE